MERLNHSNNVSVASWLLLLLFGWLMATVVLAQNETVKDIDVGVILDIETLAGKKAKTSLSMAVEEFYEAHSNYSTKAVLHFRDSQSDVVQAAAAATDLMTNLNISSIIGPPTSTEANFIIKLGSKNHLPILSFSATSPSLYAPYFIRTTLNDSSQVPVLAALIDQFAFREVIPIYEDSPFGTGILPYLVDAFQSVQARIPYRSVVIPSASDNELDSELYKLMAMQTRVFIVHMLPVLAFRLFSRAYKIGMMSKGYVWIVTDGIADLFENMDRNVMDTMQGVIGVRPFVNQTAEVVEFSVRFKDRFRGENPGVEPPEPSIYQLWAYDTVWAVAEAVERVRFTNSTGLGQVGFFQNGPVLLNELLKTRFKGLAGEFELVGNQIVSSMFEIVNVKGRGARNVGFWKLAIGLSKSLSSANSDGLLPVAWPGDSVYVPKGWEIPTKGKKLRIGVPIKHGFTEFVNVGFDPVTNKTTVGGYCIDVFNAVIALLPYDVPIEYIPFHSHWSYDNLVYQVYLKKFDGVVGDVTILTNRTQYVDFTLPFTESGVSMIVPVKKNINKSAWIFLKPLTTDLWLASLTFFIFTGFVMWVIEHSQNEDFGVKISEQLGTIFYFTFSFLVFAHKEKLKSNLTRLIVLVWVFVVLILTTSYTASLTSMLTVQQLQPTVTQVKELLKTGAYVGYQEGSFIKTLLINKLGFDKHKLRSYSTADQYAEALLNGSANGGVDALFDELPYLKLFLSDSKRCSDFTMVGRSYKTDGFGFVFPRGSPLIPDISRAILNVTESDKMTIIERQWLGDPSNCPSPINTISSSSIRFQSFRGLFLVTGVVSSLALLIHLAKFIYDEWYQLRIAASAESSFLYKLVALYKHYHGTSRPLVSPTLNNENSINANPLDDSMHGNVQAEALIGSQSPVSMLNDSEFSFGSPENGLSSTEHSPSRRTQDERPVDIVAIREGG